MRSVESVAEVGNVTLNPEGIVGDGGGAGGGDGEIPESGGPAGGLVNSMRVREVSAIAKRSQRVVADR